MAKFIDVMSEEDLPKGKSAIVSAGKDEIALFNYKGKYYAINNKCLHNGSSLGEGRIEEGILICPNHEWRFDLVTGQCPQNPEMCAKIFPVKVGKGRIKIDIGGDENKLPPGKIPSKAPSALNFTIPTIQKPINPDEDLG
jgi:nitrite reductase (NADH) small subunit/3-phenylpropionate/trans-cinnamate dioxygenase ferredoxin subunit